MLSSSTVKVNSVWEKNRLCYYILNVWFIISSSLYGWKQAAERCYFFPPYICSLEVKKFPSVLFAQGGKRAHKTWCLIFKMSQTWWSEVQSQLSWESSQWFPPSLANLHKRSSSYHFELTKQNRENKQLMYLCKTARLSVLT